MPRHLVYRFDGEFIYPAPPKPQVPERTETQQDATIPPAALSPQQVADYLGVSRSYVYGLLDRGALPWFRIGRLRKVLRQDADEFLQRLRDEAGGGR